MKKFTIILFTFLMAFACDGWGQATIYSQGFETDLSGYSHTPSQTPATDPGDQYFSRAEPSDGNIYEDSGGPYTNVTGSWLFVGSNPNTINSGNPGILSFTSIDVDGYSDFEFHADFGAVPNDWDVLDDLYVEYQFDAGDWTTMYSFEAGGTNLPISLTGNASGGINTANGITLTYALATISSNNFTGSGSTLNIRIVCDAGANYEAFGVDNVIVKGIPAGGVNNPTDISATASSTTQIDLSWTENGNSNDVLIAWNSINTFGSPEDGSSYSSGALIPDGGTSLGTDADGAFNHASLDPNTQYFYKIWSVDGSINYSTGVTDNATTLKIEPTSYPADFTATTNSSSQITLSWTDAAGAQPPDNYLIKASILDNVDNPVDGTAVVDNTTIGNNSGAVNVAQGVGTYAWSGLDAETTYYFKIYPYTNSGDVINYKTDDTPPSANATTEEVPSIVAPTAGVVFISEVCDALSDYNSEFLELYNNSSDIIDLSSSKIIMYPSGGGVSQAVFDFGVDGSGDTQIPANGIIVISRGASKAEFVTEWGPYPLGANYNEGTGGLYFGTGRQWALKDGGTANTDDGTEIDATNQDVADGDGDYQYPTGTWNAEIEADATPGTVSSTQDPAAYLWDGGAITTSWGDANNWDPNQTPSSNTNVTIPSGKASITIEFDETADCYNLAVEGTLTIKSDAAGTGSLIVNGTISGGGTTTMERYMTAYTNDANGWHLLASPVNNFAIDASDFDPGDNDDFFAWDEVNFQWLNHKVGANNITNFVNGKGYLVSYQATGTKDFSGTFNNSDVTFSNLTKTTGKGEGWHLLGNPFQSALQWTNTDWVRINIGVGAKIMNSGGSYQDITVNGTDIIPANQGFFVQASVDKSNTFTIPKSQCVHSSTAFYKNSIPNRLTLKATDGDFYVETWIQCMDGSTENYDEDYDVRFLSGISGAPKLYSIVGEENLSTNRIPQVENESIVSLGFKSENQTIINIQAIGIESFANYTKILLEDTQENEIINLRENPEFSFNSNPENNIERFKLHFKSTTGINENDNNNFDIYSNNCTVYIINPKFVDANVVVYNIMGQEIDHMKINGNEFKSFQLDVKQGYYIVKVISDQSISTEKVYIK